MEQDIQNLQKSIEEQSAKIDALYISAEKTRKYFMITLWVTVFAVLLPLLGLFFAVPSFLSSYTGTMQIRE
jgi:hypothetical protein